MLLGVNIDHIAYLRNMRQTFHPDPLEAAYVCEKTNVAQITIHLREDRRHIKEYDLKRIIDNASLPINLECSLSEEIINIVLETKPHRATLVPERREELTTEGGLNLDDKRLQNTIKTLQDNDIEVGLFIAPNENDISHAKTLGTNAIELHTGHYANLYAKCYSNIDKTPFATKNTTRANLKKLLDDEVLKIQRGASLGKELGLFVAAGHGLDYHNVEKIAKIPQISELNIGQSIIARSVFVGLKTAIEEMKALCENQ